MFDSLQNKQLRGRNGRNKNNLRPLVLILGFFAVASLGIITFALLQKWNYSASAAPGIYRTLNYQGKLEDSGGATVADGAYNIKFTIYDTAAAGNVLWTARESDACGAPFNPSAKSVTVTSGVFSTQLGEAGDCPINLDFNDDSYYLGITVGADLEMTPRKRIGAAGYAFNADLLDGLNTSLIGGAASFVPATDASGNLVLTANVTFDTNTFFLDSTNNNIGIGTAAPNINRTLDLTTANKYGIYSVSSYPANDATAVYGEASDLTNHRQYGGYFIAAGPTGHGVHGTATSASAPMTPNYGGYFTSAGVSGYGVYGEGSVSGAVTNYGGSFWAAGDTGYGVYSVAAGTAGINYGGYFRANGAGGYGVYGYAANTTAVANYGGYFKADGSANYTTAVKGEAASTAAIANIGGWFTAAGTAGSPVGVSGQATATTGALENVGGYFSAAGERGRAVMADASSTAADENFGVRSTARGSGNGTSAVWGSATATGLVTNYGGYFTANGDTGYGVRGFASASGAVNYGGYFRSEGDGGYGVYGWNTRALGTSAGYGGFFRADSGLAQAVHGEATYDISPTTNYGGYFTAAGTGAGTSGVYGAASATGAVVNYGGYFTTAGDSGTAVYGAATSVAGTANNIGGYFTAAGGAADTYGVYATATGGGNNFGIYASTISATGWAGYFNGGRGIYALRFSINDGITAVDYNTIGPALAGHVAAGEITDQNDLFINGNLEVNGAVWLDGGHTDLAEMVAYSGEGEAGDVVVVDENNDNSAKIAARPYDQSILGIISTKPTLVITGDIKEGKLMAVAGRVPTKVTNINGAIHRGDPLTTSSMPGYAMKATEAGPIVGKALGECDERECVIWVFLNVSWYGGM